MGIEQGTPVVGSSPDLPSNIDIPDLRLPRAFRVWADFSITHSQQIASMGSLQPREVVRLLGGLSDSIGQEIGVGAGSEVSEDKIIQLTNIISGQGNRVIFMRHGEQKPPDWIDSIPDPKLRKIRMMQDPFNRENLLTDRGLQDVFVTAFALFYVTQATGKRVHIFSSENTRAKEVAEIVQVIVPDSTLAIHDGLNCITYKDESDQPPIMVGDLLEALPLGTMPWEPELVDRWCKATKNGTKQSVAITEEIEGLTNLGIGQGNDLFLVLTHSQQLAEVLRVAGKLQNSGIRFSELTMILTGDRRDLTIFPRGVLSEVAKDQSANI